MDIKEKIEQGRGAWSPGARRVRVSGRPPHRQAWTGLIGLRSVPGLSRASRLVKHARESSPLGTSSWSLGTGDEYHRLLAQPVTLDTPSFSAMWVPLLLDHQATVCPRWLTPWLGKQPLSPVQAFGGAEAFCGFRDESLRGGFRGAVRSPGASWA